MTFSFNKCLFIAMFYFTKAPIAVGKLETHRLNGGDLETVQPRYM